MKKYEVTASTVVYAEDDVNALTEGIRVFKNISICLRSNYMLSR